MRAKPILPPLATSLSTRLAILESRQSNSEGINLKKKVYTITLPYIQFSITLLSYFINLHLFLQACDELYKPFNKINRIKDLLYKDIFSEESNDNKSELSYQAHQLTRCQRSFKIYWQFSCAHFWALYQKNKI